VRGGAEDRHRFLIGSTNPGKLREYREILQGLDLELVAPTDLDPVPTEPAEDADTFVENASLKARAYATASGLQTIADDSGLEVYALRGAPGVRSRRFFGDDASAETASKARCVARSRSHRVVRRASATTPCSSSPGMAARWLSCRRRKSTVFLTAGSRARSYGRVSPPGRRRLTSRFASSRDIPPVGRQSWRSPSPLEQYAQRSSCMVRASFGSAVWCSARAQTKSMRSSI